MNDKNIVKRDFNIEIEIKIKLEEKEMLKLESWLRDNAKRLGKVSQTDMYFNNPNMPFVLSENICDINKWLRVRESKPKSSICFKECHRDIQGRILYSDEIETGVDDTDKVCRILKSIGYNQIVEVIKQRVTYLVDNFRFDLDVIYNLGKFVEIEYLGYLEDYTKGQQIIKNFISKIGISKYEEIHSSYPQMCGLN